MDYIYTFYDMESEHDKYWHIQMHKPDGRQSAFTIRSRDLLEEPQPVIGTSEWESKQCEDFKHIPEGSIVLVREGKKSIALCRITGPNRSDEALEKKYHSIHYRDVEVLGFISDEEQPAPRRFSQGTFVSCGSHTKQWQYINRLYTSMTTGKEENTALRRYTELLKSKKNIILQGAPGTGKTYTTAALAVGICNESFADFDKRAKLMEEYERLRASGRISFCTFHQSLDYEDFVEGLKPQLENGHISYRIEPGIFKSICREAALQGQKGEDIRALIDKYLETIKGYENRKKIPTSTGRSSIEVWWEEGNQTISIRSIRPLSPQVETYAPARPNIDKIKELALGGEGEKNWQSYAQAFIQAVKEEYPQCESTPELPYVLIIDEINRGNISKIFGELITLLEADKRSGGGEHSLHVKLPYSKEDFSVPSNLYIIGTMNTTDRSTGSIDYAVRRRFAFVTLEPRATALREHYAEPSRAIPSEVQDAALALFEQINGTTEGSESFIAKHKAMDFDLEDLKVGHSYFMAESLEALQLKMRYEVIPLLQEYIKDGILRQLPDDEQYFACWREAKPFTPQPTDNQQG